ncbi:DUF4136 domain-containing protein [Shewanella gaetbuli]|uniref:DUF4136 domain-containing protein n=1 Tax=Shewanella gaetbuli TaxID=220752 RepID=A0A9X1ZLX4_9GAMM|nr:DUF4136 domain-containing protein [Shewanella gaetbuli]MCL1143382.1 DUF4136 domain-containing protein [Shewanella gaetbuli]
MLKSILCFFMAASIMMLSGCATDHHSVAEHRMTMVTSGDVSLATQTYAWHETMFSIHTANKMDEEELKRHLRQSVDKLMASKGYVLVANNQNPQMTVGFGMALESEMSDMEILAKAGLVPGLSTQDVSDEYEKGSVLIAFFNPRINQPFWRVLAQGFTDPHKTVVNREVKFDELANMMLSNIPDVH